MPHQLDYKAVILITDDLTRCLRFVIANAGCCSFFLIFVFCPLVQRLLYRLREGQERGEETGVEKTRVPLRQHCLGSFDSLHRVHRGGLAAVSVSVHRPFMSNFTFGPFDEQNMIMEVI